MTTKKHEVPKELLASLLADYKKPEDLIGENGLLKQLTKLLVEKALDTALAMDVSARRALHRVSAGRARRARGARHNGGLVNPQGREGPRPQR